MKFILLKPNFILNLSGIQELHTSLQFQRWKSWVFTNLLIFLIVRVYTLCILRRSIRYNTVLLISSIFTKFSVHSKTIHAHYLNFLLFSSLLLAFYLILTTTCLIFADYLHFFAGCGSCPRVLRQAGFNCHQNLQPWTDCASLLVNFFSIYFLRTTSLCVVQII